MTDSVVGRRPVSKAWSAFHERLTETLRTLSEDQFLVLIRKETNRFVQFAAQGSFGMRAEVVSNSYLRGADRFSPDDTAMLRALGWNDPTSGAASSPRQDPDGSPNHFREWEPPVDHSEIATLAVRTLIEVLDVAHLGVLEYQAFHDSGSQILLPSLGLTRGNQT